jgi:hypothetical protein
MPTVGVSSKKKNRDKNSEYGVAYQDEGKYTPGEQKLK